jgi:cation diffusion facilitator family transporter
MSGQIKNNNLKRSQKVAEKAIWLEGTLVILKIAAAILSGSLALISDAIHSASDIVSIVTSWLGLKIAQKAPDRKFHYGYYKAENFGALIISFLVIYAGWKMLEQAYFSLGTSSEINVPLFALAVSLVDAIILFFFGNYEVRVGTETRAQSLIAMGKENRTHIFSSSAVFLGTLAAYYQIPYVASVVTLGISLLIFEIGFSTLKNAASVLLDVSPDPEIEEKIAGVLKDISGIEAYSDLRLRQSGPSVFGEVKVGIRKSVDVARSHEIANKVEAAVQQAVPEVDSLSVHVEPFQSEYRHLVIPVKEKNGLNSTLAKQLARAPYLLFVNLRKTEIKGFYFLDNPFKDQKQRAGLAVAKLVLKQKSDTVITPQIGEISFFALRDYLFDIYQAKGGTAQKAINLFVEDELVKLTKPTIQKS